MAANRSAPKSAAAFRTISEVSDELQVPQHVLRFWETKFSQVRPMKRGGGRRYYRPEDIELLRQIRDLLYSDGYTIKGVQKLLREGQVKPPPAEQAIAQKEREGAPPPPEGSHLAARAQTPGKDTAAAGEAAESPAGPARAAPHSGAAAAGGSGQSAVATAAPPASAVSGEEGGGQPLSEAQRRELQEILDELRAARAELRRRTGQ